MDFRPFILLALNLGIVGFLLLHKRHRLLLGWICVVSVVNIFDVNLFINLPAARLAGLLLLPQTLRYARTLLKTPAGRTLLLHLLWLVSLAVVFGFILPWNSGLDAGLQRTLNEQPPGRALIGIARAVADLSLAVFAARVVVTHKCPVDIVRWVVGASAATGFAGLIEYLTHADVYYFITGLRPLEIAFRARGLNYEPRGLGLSAVTGLVLAVLLFMDRHSARSLFLAVVSAVAVFVTASTSALAVLLAGVLGLMVSDRRLLSPPIWFIAAALACLWIAGIPQELPMLQGWFLNADIRLSVGRLGLAPQSPLQAFIFHFDTFDLLALLFFAARPLYLLWGAGPGMISFPSTDYLPASHYFDFLRVSGVNALPSTGLVQELADGGAVALCLWLLFVCLTLRAFTAFMKRGAEGNEWRIARAAFLIMSVVYLVQVSPYANLWSLFAGAGLGASALAADQIRAEHRDARSRALARRTRQFPLEDPYRGHVAARRRHSDPQ